MKRPMKDPWKDFDSILFSNIVSSLSPAQILGRAKVFCKILGRTKVFCKILGPANVLCEKFESSWSPACLKVQLKCFHSLNVSSMVFS